MGAHKERREKTRAEKLEAVRAAVESGALVVRQASEAERERWARERAQRPNTAGGRRNG
jgi:hypothetical protein